MVLGLVSGTVKIEEYNLNWQFEFEREKAILLSQLQNYCVSIQHVGSTSIQGCCAKPIIDIAIGVESLEYGEKLIPILSGIGYLYCGDAGIPGRHFFKKQNGELSTHYIHVEPIGGKLWNNHILFRDYLNRHPETVYEYSSLKRSLEKDFFNDRNGYALRKNPLIEEVIGNAERERKIGGK